jgi:hypothetical protein
MIANTLGHHVTAMWIAAHVDRFAMVFNPSARHEMIRGSGENRL